MTIAKLDEAIIRLLTLNWGDSFSKVFKMNYWISLLHKYNIHDGLNYSKALKLCELNNIAR